MCLPEAKENGEEQQMSKEVQGTELNAVHSELNKPEAIVFDMDGTLFQTESLYYLHIIKCSIFCGKRDYTQDQHRRKSLF